MRHARPAALDELESLLDELRTVDGLTEKKRGVFSRGSGAFVHFHEDPGGLYADVRIDADFERFAVEPRRRRRCRDRDEPREANPVRGRGRGDGRDVGGRS